MFAQAFSQLLLNRINSAKKLFKGMYIHSARGLEKNQEQESAKAKCESTFTF
jgi:hypothetical protein